MNLTDYRNQIDELDRELVKLFLLRLHTVKEVKMYKENHNLPIVHRQREEEVLKKNLASVEKEFYPYVKEFLETLIRLSTDLQR